MATETNEPVRLPPGPRMPKVFQGIAFLTALQFRVAPDLSRRYGGPFTINLPIFGKTVVVSDPTLVKDVYSTSSDLIERPTKILGQHSAPVRRSASPAMNTWNAANWYCRPFMENG